MHIAARVLSSMLFRRSRGKYHSRLTPAHLLACETSVSLSFIYGVYKGNRNGWRGLHWFASC